MDPALGNVISYQRLQLITYGQHKMGWKIPVVLMCCPPPPICALEAGDPERVAAPLRATCLCCGEVGDENPAPGLGPTWGRGSLGPAPRLVDDAIAA